MRIPYWHVDAFTGPGCRGNPAGVCRLREWLPDRTLQDIAAENNLSETAFFVEQQGEIPLRWFTPVREIDLCGHATLAAAHVIFAGGAHAGNRVAFGSASGPLAVERRGELLVLDFPVRPAAPCAAPDDLTAGLGASPLEVHNARDYMAVFSSEEEVRALAPHMGPLARLPFGVIATAPGREVDFVSRFFAPAVGIPEDPVTGSSHCTLVPYWAGRLGRRTLTARQLSPRGGELFLEHAGDRVRIGGRAVTFLSGEIVS